MVKNVERRRLADVFNQTCNYAVLLIFLSLSAHVCMFVCSLQCIRKVGVLFVVFLIVYMECENVVGVGKRILTGVSTKRRQNENKGLFDFIDDTRNGLDFELRSIG